MWRFWVRKRWKEGDDPPTAPELNALINEGDILSCLGGEDGPALLTAHLGGGRYSYVMEDGRSGDDAYDANAKTTLTGEVVYLRLSEAGDYRFVLPRVGTPCPGQFCVRIRGCFVPPGVYHHLAAGATVTVFKSGVEVGTCTFPTTEFSSQPYIQCCIAIEGEGSDYSFTVEKEGWGAYEDVDLTAGCSVNTFTVDLCKLLPECLTLHTPYGDIDFPTRPLCVCVMHGPMTTATRGSSSCTLDEAGSARLDYCLGCNETELGLSIAWVARLCNPAGIWAPITNVAVPPYCSTVPWNCETEGVGIPNPCEPINFLRFVTGTGKICLTPDVIEAGEWEFTLQVLAGPIFEAPFRAYPYVTDDTLLLTECEDEDPDPDPDPDPPDP